mmetsp:Transcript_52300/g.59777  ORF Transcript_52300/g.59777 Transcript_52300/m.59777 type:complete len:176 (+) Transcript_52300:54-581(+)
MVDSGQAGEYKVVIFGNAKVGKSSFIQRHTTGEFFEGDVPSLGIGIGRPLSLLTSKGIITLNLFDTSQSSDNLEICSNADGGILMFDVTSQESYREVSDHFNKFVSVRPNSFVTMVGNKVDIPNRVVKAKDITFHRKKNLQYYDISVKSQYNLEKPLLWLMRKFKEDPSLTLKAE